MIWLLTTIALAGPQPGYDAGIAAIRDGDYTGAVKALESSIEAGGQDPAVYHALGNALYRQGRLGHAIAAWRRGQTLAPTNGDIGANIDQALRQTKDRLEPPASAHGPFFWMYTLSIRQTLLVGTGFLSVAGWALLGRLAAHRWARIWRWMPITGWVSLVLGALLCIGGLQAMMAPPHAVVVVESVGVQSALGPDGLELFVLHEGTEAKVQESTDSHALIEIGDARKGWVPAEAIVSTDPDVPVSWTALSR